MEKDKEFQFSHTPIDIKKYQNNPYEINRSRIIEDMVPQGQQMPAFDIGCGPGYFTRILSKKAGEQQSLILIAKT